MNRGDIYWFHFKVPDKARPALILTRESAISYLNSVTVAPITTALRNNDTSVWLDEADGLMEPCLVNADNIQTVDKTKAGKFITHLSKERMDEVFDAIKFAFGFEDK